MVTRLEGGKVEWGCLLLPEEAKEVKADFRILTEGGGGGGRGEGNCNREQEWCSIEGRGAVESNVSKAMEFYEVGAVEFDNVRTMGFDAGSDEAHQCQS